MWFVLAPFLIALGGAAATLAVDAVSEPRSAVDTAAVGLVAAAVVFGAQAGRPLTAIGTSFAGGGTYAVLGAGVCALAALSLIAGRSRLGDLPHGGQAAALVAFSATASAALLGAVDLAAFVVALELVSLTAYALVAAGGTSRAYEAAMKYFVQGAIATGLLAYAVALLFGAFGGVTGYGPLEQAIRVAGDGPVLTTGVVLLLAALAFKLGAFPFHSWTPDAYEHAPAPVAAYLATAPKVASLVAALMLLLGVFGSQAGVWRPLVASLAAASIAFGNLAALKQTSLRRMLAYSGVAQVGYALVGVAAGEGTAGLVVLFGVFYAVAAAGAFLAAEAAGEGRVWDGRIATLAGLARRRPLLAASLSVCLLSMTGIPLTVGFWGKLLVFRAAAGSGLLWLAAVGMIGSVVSFGYYGGVLRAVYLDDPAELPVPDPLPEPEGRGAAEVGELVPRSVGAMAAQPQEGETDGSPGEWAVVLLAALLLVGGIAPLFLGLEVFGFLVS